MKFMARRRVKRRSGKIAFIMFLILAAAALGFILLNLFKILHFNFKTWDTASNSNVKILKPNVNVGGIAELKREIKAKNIIFDELAESTSSAILIVGKVRDGPKVYFSQNKEADWQVNSLQLILLKLGIDSKKPVLIDLRGARPIVKF